MKIITYQKIPILKTLLLTGTAAINGTGNGLANTLTLDVQVFSLPKVIKLA